MESIPWLIAATLVVVFVHLLSPVSFRWRERSAKAMEAFAGGVAVAYVFLHLLPEVDTAHAGVGSAIHVLMLVGFGGFYLAETWARSREEDNPAPAHGVHVGLAAVYEALLVYTAGEHLPHTVFGFIAWAGAIALHLSFADHGRQERFGALFTSRGRLVLVVAAIIGGLCAALTELPEAPLDVLTVLLVGFGIFTVFHEELGELELRRALPFSGGALVYSGLIALGG